LPGRPHRGVRSTSAAVVAGDPSRRVVPANPRPARSARRVGPAPPRRARNAPASPNQAPTYSIVYGPPNVSSTWARGKPPCLQKSTRLSVPRSTTAFGETLARPVARLGVGPGSARSAPERGPCDVGGTARPAPEAGVQPHAGVPPVKNSFEQILAVPRPPFPSGPRRPSRIRSQRGPRFPSARPPLLTAR